MASTCIKCNGIGFLQGFAHIANGECFSCKGTGHFLTNAERAAIITERSERADRQMAKEQGVSLDVLRAYLAPARYGIDIPKDERGFSPTIQEFAKWMEARV